MSSEKSFPPSERRCEELRHRGIMPYSGEFVSAGVIGGAAVGVWWFGSGALGAVVQLFRLVCRPGGSLSGGQGSDGSAIPLLVKSGEVFLLGTLQLLTPVLVFSLGLHLWQSGVSFRFSRVRRVRRQRGDRQLVVGLTGAFCFLGIVFLCVAPELQGVMGNDWRWSIRAVFEGEEPEVVTVLGSLLVRVLGAAGSTAVTVGVFAFVVAKIRFLRRYSMSREEVEAETREGEMRPETRQAVQVGYRDE